ncbi:protransforming growth factor alpha [Trichomycterus rosablanca]|uniref:protransforming growth factor alpha n=1 Tax=Trichomycterus rosablanca TaxID=2290929 RepID=UPI002F35A769
MYRALWNTIFFLTGYLFTYGKIQENSTPLTTMEMTPTAVTTTSTTTISSKADTSTTNVLKKLIAAAVHSHFSDCPDSHSHFCFHGTCRFLILEKMPACVCQPGFIGMRCEHADLLAVVATNHKQDAVTTMLMLCILGSVLVILVCTIINCWWRRGRCRRGPIICCFSENPNGLIKRESFCHQSERVFYSSKVSYKAIKKHSDLMC